MNTPFFIAHRLAYGQNQTGKDISRPAVRVATAGVSIGFVVMLLTLFIVIGFKREVKNKVVGFGSHIQVVNFDNNNTYQMQSIVATDSLLNVLNQTEHVSEVLLFCTKPGILKTDSAFHGIVIKGRDAYTSVKTTDRKPDFFEQNIVDGRMPIERNEIIISKQQATQMLLTTGDTCLCYFVDEHVRTRRYVITGIYDTQFSDFDDLFVIGKHDEVQQLNGFERDEVSGIEILISDFRLLDDVAEQVYLATSNRPDTNGNLLYTETIEEQQPGIFAWLRLLDMNVVIIILLMMSVSAFCIISGLIIIILDSIPLIGTLKALGAENKFIRKMFLYQAAHLIGNGLIIGNIIGLTLSCLQYFYHIIPLDRTTYYVSFVPIALSPTAWLLLNIATVAVSMLVLLAPSSIVTRISPAQVMRYE
ncbi:MAG: ABC transporter permease [Paludibacteraceae bacterium]|nr:ABC transporter permease [Paludibacteraceae bacterium]